MADWNPIAKVYNPLKAGSIDGTDVEPHDRAVWRAMCAHYKPNKSVVGDPLLTLFVSRLNPLTTEEKLHQVFSKFGDIKRIRLVRDVVTGFSKRYAFIEYKEERSVVRARRDANKLVVDQQELFVDFEHERTLKGWIPRRLGGGLGGKKESGQLRFGGRDRPFRKPINLGAGPSLQEWPTGGRREWERPSERDREYRSDRDKRGPSRDERSFRGRENSRYQERNSRHRDRR
ncbi:U11/U12 small nuclear ribonucleoprotein 35 kDa protein [Stigmatopora nigra]